MPCGGIYPVIGDYAIGLIKEQNIDNDQCICYYCQKPSAGHFCDEWDMFIHARCVPDFLKTDEGKCVIAHGHTVILDFSLEIKGNTVSELPSESCGNP